MRDVEFGGIEREFCGAVLGDRRLAARLLKIARRLEHDPSMSFPTAFDDSELEGAYRFFGNESVDPEAILAPHVGQTLSRMGSELTLMLHDSSTLSFGSVGHRDGLSDSTGGHQHFLAHVSLAVSGDGTRRPLGVVALSRHVVGQGRRQHKSDQTGRLQDRWAEHVDRVHALGVDPQRTIHLMDRESDDYEVFARLAELGGRFVIRMQHNRALLEGDAIRNRLPGLPLLATRTVRLGARVGHLGAKQKRTHPPREERTASLAIGGTTIEIKRPESASAATQPSYRLNLVYVREVDPPDPKSAVEWILLTSEPIDTAEQLLLVVDYYRSRWVIEELFKALKTGCSLEKRQLGNLHALGNALAVLLPLAWKLLALRTTARQNPDAPATLVLDRDELEVLRSVAKRPLPPEPTVHQAMLAVAALGGHLKRNGEPGWQTLARGYERLLTFTLGWRLGVASRSDQS